MSSDKGRPLPKFGEWDVNNPASAEGFTVIFNKARDDKKTNTTNASAPSGRSDISGATPTPKSNYPKKKSWLCFS